MSRAGCQLSCVEQVPIPRCIRTVEISDIKRAFSASKKSLSPAGACDGRGIDMVVKRAMVKDAFVDNFESGGRCFGGLYNF